MTRSCTLIAVDFDTTRVDPNGKRIFETREFRVDQEADARAFLGEKRRTVVAAISKRMLVTDGRWFRVEWIADGGGVLCESEGLRDLREPRDHR
jgi:hypothetical protein